jgi:hypothetical protein
MRIPSSVPAPGAASPPVPPIAAHAIARIVAGIDPGDALGALTGRWRRIADRLADYEVEHRTDVLSDTLVALDDPDGVLGAIRALDPTAEAPPAGPAPRPRYKLLRTADVTCRPVAWLWRPRVPRGMLSLMAGDPKLGKSLVLIAMAAAISRGFAHPGGDPPDGPGSVILLSAEDDPSRTIVPRLKAAGADLSKVHILESVFLDDGSEALPSLRTDIEIIEQAITQLGDCRMVGIDPVSAYLGGIDDHKNSEVRGLLAPLKSLAERTEVAVPLVSHLNKGVGTNGKHRVMGSLAYVGTCRANFLFVRDAADPTGRRVLMLDNGCNLAADVPTLAYRIQDRGGGPAVEWEAEPVNITAEQALAAQVDRQNKNGDRSKCDEWLREALASGPVATSEILRLGVEAGFSKTALERAKSRIGASSDRDGFGRGGTWFWTLTPDAPGDASAPP